MRVARHLLAFVVLSLLVSTPGGSQAASSLDEVAIPRRTAELLGISPGDILEVSSDPLMTAPHRVRVAVVWDPPEHPADVARRDLVIRFHLPVLEALLDRPDVVDRIVVRLKDSTQARKVRDDLNGSGRGYEAYTAADLAQQTSRTFVVISRFHRAIALITLLASGIFLVTIMTLKLTEIRREIGVLRLLGIGNRTITLAVVGMAAVVAAAGTVIGIGLGAVLVRAINAYYQPVFETTLRFAIITPGALQLIAVLAMLLGVGAGLAVSRRLLRRRPLDQVGR